MGENSSIARVSKIFRIPSSALRYWDDEGLIRFAREPENQYRKPTFQTMMDICEVALYRSMSVPLKEIRKLPDMRMEELQGTLEKNESRLEDQIRQLEASVDRIRAKKEMLERLDCLKREGFTVELRALPAVRTFSIYDEAAVQAYMGDCYLAALLIDDKGLGQGSFGVCLPDEDDDWTGAGALLRGKDAQERQYLKGLLRVDSGSVSEHNGAEFAACAAALGFEPGAIFGLYLLSASDGQRFDYYEAWMELLTF